MDVPGLALSVLAWLGGVLAPGVALATALGLGRNALERLVIAIPLGRVLLALVTLACVDSARASWLAGWPIAGALALAAALVAARRRRTGGSPLPRGALVASLAAGAAGLLLVVAVVARSGVADPSGALAFHGRDATDDPLVYASAALRLFHSGLPLTHPFAAGAPATAQYVALAGLAGLHGGGAPILELAFRTLPAFDVISAALAVVALALALGATAPGAAAGGIGLALGGGAAFALPWLGALLGRSVQRVDTWAFFGPYLLAFNPIAPALGALFAACLLLLDADTGRRRTRALVAGLLVASLFEIKLFLWAPALAGLLAAALLAPPAARAAFRLAAAGALLGSLPSLVEKALAARRAAGVAGIAFEPCPGCTARYVVDASLGSHELSFALFKSFRLVDLLAPGVLAAALGASALWLGIGLGARWIALPELLRAFRGGASDARDAHRRGVLRWLALGSAAALAAGLGVVVAPHYLNGAQFVWLASYGLWPVAALPLGRWLATGRLALVLAVAALALPDGLDAVGRLGFGAPPRAPVRADERELCDVLARLTGPDDRVLEPSILLDADSASPIPYLAGRAVHLSLLSTVQSLSEAERNRRFEELLAVFAGDDPSAAARAVAASGARWVVVPFGWRPRVELAQLLEPAWRGPGGAIYRAPPADAGRR